MTEEEEKKTKKKTRLFDQPYLTNGTCELNEICYVACYRWRALIMQKLCAFDKGSWSYACVKIAFLLFLLIYSRCGAQALFTWPHDTLPCVLIPIHDVSIRVPPIQKIPTDPIPMPSSKFSPIQIPIIIIQFPYLSN